MNDIEFIKKSMPFADGFELVLQTFELEPFFQFKTPFNSHYSFREKVTMYESTEGCSIMSHFLTRTIEGINREELRKLGNTNQTIRAEYEPFDDKYAYYIGGKVSDILYHSIDQAKRSAIEYVLERL